MEAYLQSIQGQGTRVSSGVFSLDLAAAYKKLAGFFAPEELDFLHYWVRFAVAEGAAAIEVQASRSGIRLGFRGAVPPREVFLDGALTTDLSPRYLQMGNLGAYRQGACSIRVLHPEFCLEFVDGKPRLDHHGGGANCWLEALSAKATRHWGNSKALQRALDFPQLPIPLSVNGKVWNPTSRRSLLQLQDEQGQSLTVELADPKVALQPAQLRVLVHGADLAGLASLSFPPGSRVYWGNNQLPLDLSLRRLRQDSLARLTCDHLSLQLAEHLNLCLQEGRLKVEQLGLPTWDWLVEQVCRIGELDRAFQLFTQAAPLFREPTLLYTGWRERGAQLALALGKSQAEKFWKDAHQGWQNWLQLAAEADPQWKNATLEPQGAKERQVALDFQRHWSQLVLAGCLCRTQPEGLIPALANMRGSLTLHLYQEWVRQSIHGGRPGKEFLRHLERYRKDSLVRSVLYLQELTALGPSETCKPEAMFAADIIVAAALGQEAPGDLPDLSVLTADHRASLLEVVQRFCQTQTGQPECARLLASCEGWFQAQELE